MNPLAEPIPHTGVNAHVNVERGLLRESLVADFTLEGPLASVRAVVDLEVRLACKRGGALHALIRTPLHCPGECKC